jgi:hypothetical protein
MESASFAPPTGLAFGEAFFLQWMSCEHPHDRTGRICDLRFGTGGPGAIILARGTRSRGGNSTPPLVTMRAVRPATTWRPSDLLGLCAPRLPRATC